MKKLVLPLFVTLGFAGAAIAQDVPTPDFTALDVDASGEISFEELTAQWPDVTAEAFAGADTDVSGGLNADELATFLATR